MLNWLQSADANDDSLRLRALIKLARNLPLTPEERARLATLGAPETETLRDAFKQALKKILTNPKVRNQQLKLYAAVVYVDDLADEHLLNWVRAEFEPTHWVACAAEALWHRDHAWLHRHEKDLLDALEVLLSAKVLTVNDNRAAQLLLELLPQVQNSNHWRDWDRRLQQLWEIAHWHGNDVIERFVERNWVFLTRFAEIDDHIDDVTWLNEHAETVFHTLQSMIMNGKNAYCKDALEVLADLMPILRHQPLLERWSTLLLKGYERVFINSRNNDHNLRMQAELYLAMSEITTQPELAENYIMLAFRSLMEARPGRHPDVAGRLAVLIVEFWTLHVNKMQVIDAEAYLEDLEIRYENNPTFLAHFHYACCFRYTHILMQQPDHPVAMNQAVLHGLVAEAIWHKLGSTTERVRSLGALANALWVAKSFAAAQQMMHYGLQFADPTHHRDLARFHYILGTAMYENGQPGNCLDHLMLAATKYETLGLAFESAMAQHSLALAYYSMGKYDEAMHEMTIALRQWQDLNNLLQQAAAMHAIAYIHLGRDERQQAYWCLHMGLARCDAMPHDERRDGMEKILLDSLDEEFGGGALV